MTKGTSTLTTLPEAGDGEAEDALRQAARLLARLAIRCAVAENRSADRPKGAGDEAQHDGEEG